MITRASATQFLRYVIVGGTAAVVDVASFMLLVRWAHVDYRLSVVASFTAGTLTNFVLSNAFVFDRGNLSFLEAGGRHYVSSLGGLVVNEIVLIAMIGTLGVGALPAKLAATGVAFIANFLLIKLFAFNDRIVLFGKDA